jgi:hypothetical protein
VDLGVASKQKERARQAFQKSAKESGFFAYGSTKLVYPSLGAGSPGKSTESVTDLGPKSGVKNGGDGGNGNGGDRKKRHPFIEGLLETLPAAVLGMEKTEWSLQGRREWLQTASGIFNLIYKGTGEDTDGYSLVVTVVPLPPSSAK